jgi:hypothetical protein
MRPSVMARYPLKPAPTRLPDARRRRRALSRYHYPGDLAERHADLLQVQESVRLTAPSGRREAAPLPHRGRGRGPARRVRVAPTGTVHRRTDPHTARYRSPPSPAVRLWHTRIAKSLGTAEAVGLAGARRARRKLVSACSVTPRDIFLFCHPGEGRGPLCRRTWMRPSGRDFAERRGVPHRRHFLPNISPAARWVPAFAGTTRRARPLMLRRLETCACRSAVRDSGRMLSSVAADSAPPYRRRCCPTR